MKKLNYLGLLLICILLYSCKAKKDYTINEADVHKHIAALSDDAMKGRKAGTEGAELAAQYIESEFKRIGLQPFFDSDAYRQNFEHNEMGMFNVVGLLPGNSKKDEYIIVSAHYDHLGIKDEGEGDLIFNGANDNASGTAAVISLAEYWANRADNERSILFVAFTAEEMGLIGSNHFGTQIDADHIIAGINIEMIGKESSYGPNTAWITGFDRSDFGNIVQKNLEGSEFTLHPDPYYPKFNLFFRSDNAALAMLGVPAHSFSTSPADDKDYHKVSDELATLDVAIITRTINVIAIGTKSLIDGSDTPTRIELTDGELGKFKKMLEKANNK